MSQRKLLLADDSITIQKVVNLTFADEGIEVITVGDGDSAMEKMAEVAPDLVMADVNMPGLNGYQVCEKIRQSEKLKTTPVILLVGSFEPFDEAEARRVGANDFLTKPFQSIRQLVNKVTDLLQNTSENGERAVSAELENATTLRNLDETPEYVAPDFSQARNAPHYGDAGMDDEMIQTNNASSFALDESPKFETREISEAEEVGKTQPLSAEDLRQFPFTNQHGEDVQAGEEAELSETATAAAAAAGNDESLNEESVPQSTRETQEMAAPQTAPVLEFEDDEDLLEIPFDGDEEEDWEEEESATETAAEVQPQAYAQPETPAGEEAPPVESETTETLQTPGQTIIVEPPEQVETPEQFESPAEAEQSQSPAAGVAGGAFTQLSPEMIEAIAQKVVEKLSDRAVKDVAWEVVPQMADLIIKKMAEDKLKE